MGAAIPQQYIHRYILSMSSRYLAVDATPGGYIYSDLILQFFCFMDVHFNPLIKVCSRDQISMKFCYKF